MSAALCPQGGVGLLPPECHVRPAPPETGLTPAHSCPRAARGWGSGALSCRPSEVLWLLPLRLVFLVPEEGCALCRESLQLSRPFRESSAGASGVSPVALARGADGWGVLRRIQRHGEGPWLCSGLRHSCSGTSGDTQVPCEPPRGPLHGEAHDGCPGCCSCNLLGATAVSERVCQSREVRFAV